MEINDFKSEILEKKNCYTFVVDIGETNNGYIDKIKNLISYFIETSPNNSKFSIIQYGENSNLISFNISDKKELEEDIKKITYMGGNSNLIQAIETISKKIIVTNTIKNRIIIFSNDPNVQPQPAQPIVQPQPVDPNVQPQPVDPNLQTQPPPTTAHVVDGNIKINSLISSFMKKGVEIFAIGFKNDIKEKYINISIPSKSIYYFENDLDLNDILTPLDDNNSPIMIRFFPKISKIQKSRESFQFILDIQLLDNTQKIKKLELEFLPNDYYYGHRISINEKLEYDSNFSTNIKLNVKNSQKDLPKKIDFKVYFNDIINMGYINMDYVYFVGDFMKSNNSRLNIMVEGAMGHGKSSCLNLLYNLFTSTHNIIQRFFSTNNSTHTTDQIEFHYIPDTFINNNSIETLLPIHQDIMDNIKISLVDKPGLTSGVGGMIDYEMLSKGCYHDRTDICNLIARTPNSEFEIHSIIIVASICEISTNRELLDKLKTQVGSIIKKAYIQPILALTFSDLYDESSIENFIDHLELPIQRENIFIVNPYIEGDTIRNPEKDLIGFKLLKRAVEIGNLTLDRKQRSSQPLNNNNLENSKNQIIGEDNNFGLTNKTKNGETTRTNYPFDITVVFNNELKRFKYSQTKSTEELYCNVRSLFCISKEFDFILKEGETEIVDKQILNEIFFQERVNLEVFIK